MRAVWEKDILLEGEKSIQNDNGCLIRNHKCQGKMAQHFTSAETYQPIILYPMKIFSRNEKEIMISLEQENIEICHKKMKLWGVVDVL